MIQAFDRAITLFDAVFTEEDDMLLVTDVHTTSCHDFLKKSPLNVYLKYVKQKKLLYKLHYDNMLNPYSEEDEKLVTHRFVLSCKTTDIRHRQLLQAICYEDFAHPTSILKNHQESGYDIYFINLSRNIMYHLYDDRVCDILAATKETIRFLYEKYNDWILEYDRNKIDLTFQ
uniref:DUF3885 domain-containing protein n=1 Tax=Sporosarcina obsidiansis TaxID=2660748 RepID=UPI001E45728F|nr:DUF3885 domain-containing protein [Sporosarcina obsidiansis]